MKAERPKFIITGKSILTAALFALAAVFTACNRQASSEVGVCEITAPIDSLVESVFPGDDAPGAIIMIIKDGEVKYSRCIGKANLATGEPLTENTLINISSASKGYIVAGILKLVEQGLVDLDTPLSHYFPEFNKDIFDKVTIAHIFTHTTGLPDLRPRNAKQWEAYLAKHPETAFVTNDDYIHFGKDYEFIKFYHDVEGFVSEPGTTSFYQDPPFMLLSSIIERVTGEEYEAWMKENIFDAADVKTACYRQSRNEGPGVAHGYKVRSYDTPAQTFVSKDSLWEEFDYGEAPFFLSRVDKGIYVTPLDHVKWLNALYGGKIISKEHYASAYDHKKDAPIQDTGFTYGCFITGGDGVQPLKLYHNNGNGGFTVFESVFPDNNVSYFIFSNYYGWNRLELSKKIDKVLKEHHWLDTLK